MEDTLHPSVIFEDSDICVINKPAGLVVHDGAGEHGETVVDWFVKNYPEVMAHTWPDITRVGIVHRLDKDTSGIMVLAKSPDALAIIQEQFQERTTEKVYQALLYGNLGETEGELVTFIGRHPKRRQEQAVLPIQIGERARREAVTSWQVQDVFHYKNQPLTLVNFYPKTGRMHQLRVHAKHLGAPIVGDMTYTIKPAKRLSKELGIERQLLHAIKLTFRHPTTHQRVTFEAPLAPDMQRVIESIA